MALVRRDDAASGAPDSDTALATLRERYARGEIDEAEFERRVAGLLETESTGTERTTLTASN